MIKRNLYMQVATLRFKIYEVRGQKIILDFDLAILYEIAINH
jgi:hypothetical protein